MPIPTAIPYYVDKTNRPPAIRQGRRDFSEVLNYVEARAEAAEALRQQPGL